MKNGVLAAQILDTHKVDKRPFKMNSNLELGEPYIYGSKP